MKCLVLLALSACGFPRATDKLACEIDSDCTGGRVCREDFCVVEDVPGDSMPPDTARFDCTAWTPAPQHFMPCDIPQPLGPVTLDLPIIYTLNTGTGELTPAGGSAIPVANEMIAGSMLISVDSLTIAAGATLRVIGPAPLIVAAWTALEVTGDIDAGSKQLEAGAGSNPTTECGLRAATDGMLQVDGGGGAGGGGFQGIGGNGGDGDLGDTNGIGGGAVTLAPLLLGGCNGAIGGAGDLPGGIGGFGGGAIQLTAKDGVTVAGKINAGGAGGEPGGTTNDGGGGGGGGAGGMIGLEGASISLGTAAIIAANGGGGGEGGDGTAGARGQDAIAVALRAQGGSANPAGNGGLGSGQGVVAGGVGANDGGGGGGGGGGGAAGFITFKPAATGTAIVTPVATIIP